MGKDMIQQQSILTKLQRACCLITFCEAGINTPIQSDVAEGQHCCLCNGNCKQWEHQEQVAVAPRSNAAFSLILE